MLIMSHPKLPEIHCLDGICVEAAEAKGYHRKSHEAVDTPEDAYERKFGKPPHHRMKLENILAALED